MSRVFVTGASSYLGTRLCRDLLADGWQVTAALHRAPLRGDLKGILQAAVDDTQASWTSALAAAQPDVVVHLAARPGTEPAGDAVREQFRGNLETGVLLLEAMRAAGCRALVNTGTFWQLGDGTDPSPTCLYAVAKSAFELFVEHAVAAQGLRACTLILYDVYGEDDPRHKLLRQLTRAARTGETMDLTPGEQLVDLVHVDDVVRAYRLAIDRVTAPGAPHHTRHALSSGDRRPLRERVAQFARALGRPVPVRWGGRPYRDREVMKPAGGPPLEGWSPRISPEEGLARAARALAREEGLT